MSVLKVLLFQLFILCITYSTFTIFITFLIFSFYKARAGQGFSLLFAIFLKTRTIESYFAYRTFMSLQIILNFKNQIARDKFLTNLKDQPDVEVKDFEDVVDLKILEKSAKKVKGLTLAQVKKQYGF